MNSPYVVYAQGGKGLFQEIGRYLHKSSAYTMMELVHLRLDGAIVGIQHEGRTIEAMAGGKHFYLEGASVS